MSGGTELEEGQVAGRLHDHQGPRNSDTGDEGEQLQEESGQLLRQKKERRKIIHGDTPYTKAMLPSLQLYHI